MTAEAFSYLIAVRVLPAAGKHFRIEADERERLRLAAAMDIPEVVALTAEVDIVPAEGRSYLLRGNLTALVVQVDVVTLEPVRLAVAEPIEVLLQPAESARRKRPEPLPDSREADETELYYGGQIDLGAIVGEHLALGLDPYPRAPDSEFTGHVEDYPDESPFAALARLKDRDQ